MSESSTWRLGAVGAGLVLILATACTDSSGEGTSEPEDLASYGCAMVADLESGDPVESWELTVELDPEAEYATAVAAAGILGGMSAAPLSGYEALHGPTGALTASLQQTDPAGIETGLGNLAAACAEENLPSGDVDTSTEGRIAFACTLTGEIHDAEVFTSDWTQSGTTSDADSLRIIKAYGVAALLGAVSASPLDGHPELTAAARTLNAGLGQADATMTVGELDTINTLCDDQ